MVHLEEIKKKSNKPHSVRSQGVRCYVQSSEQLLEVRRRALTNGSPYACPLCKRAFTRKKVFTRHLKPMSHLDQGASFVCAICGTTCSRKDVLTRHEATQHRHDSDIVQCNICLQYVRPRCLQGHQQSLACRKAANSETAPAVRPHLLARDYCYAYLSIPSCPTPILDCVLLSAWLFAKVAPWGTGKDTKDMWAVKAQRTPSYEIVKLQNLLWEAIGKSTQAPDAIRNSFLLDAIALMTIAIAMTDGWETATVHRNFLLHLTYHQIGTLYGDGKEVFVSRPPAEAFDDVLFKAVKPSERSKCLDIIHRAIVMMRLSAFDVASSMPRQTNQRINWDLIEIPAEMFVGWHEKRLRDIAEIASSVEVGA